jgi:hypothetical protein
MHEQNVNIVRRMPRDSNSRNAELADNYRDTSRGYVGYGRVLITPSSGLLAVA